MMGVTVVEHALTQTFAKNAFVLMNQLEIEFQMHKLVMVSAMMIQTLLIANMMVETVVDHVLIPRQ